MKHLHPYVANALSCLALTLLLATLALLASCTVSVAPDGTRTYEPDRESITTVAGIAAWEYARKHPVHREK